MNPFYFNGPTFLLFYFIAGVIVLLGFYIWVDLIKQQNSSIPGVMNDPYKIAFLRNGNLGAIEVAVFSLVDRKLLISGENSVESKADISSDIVSRPIEKALLRFFKHAKPWRDALSSEDVLSACEKYKKDLQSQGLIKDENILNTQKYMTLFVTFGFIAISAIKIYIAISNGRHNVGFLVLLTIFFVVLTGVIGKKRLTVIGKREFDNLKFMFANLNKRAYRLATGGQTNEAALLAAVYGLNSIPEASFPFIKYFKPQPSNGSSCSSSFSNSSSSSCGSSSSSCGGGSGCGGCGGGGGD